jgi:plasmid stabilization system protein ParE
MDAALWWSDHRSTEQAVRWLEGFEAALQTLANDPGRLPLATESGAFSVVIRQLLFGLGRTKTHRALFEVRGDEVIVHAVRHLSQQANLADDDLTLP